MSDIKQLLEAGIEECKVWMSKDDEPDDLVFNYVCIENVLQTMLAKLEEK